MYVTNEDFRALEEALNLFPKGDKFKKLNRNTQLTITKAQKTMDKLHKRRKESNKRISEYIAMRRETDPNYAR